MGCEQVWRQKWHEIGNGIAQNIFVQIFQIVIVSCFWTEICVRRVLPDPRKSFQTTREQGWAVSWDTLLITPTDILKTATWLNCDIPSYSYIAMNFWCARSPSSGNLFHFCKKIMWEQGFLQPYLKVDFRKNHFCEEKVDADVKINLILGKMRLIFTSTSTFSS